jgi:hypothetical protein
MSHTMAGKLDEISRIIGAIETSVRDLRRRAEDDRKLHDRWHAVPRSPRWRKSSIAMPIRWRRCARPLRRWNYHARN